MPLDPLEDDGMCFCCGARNPIGLKLEFEDTPEGRMRTRWTPRREHQGFKDIVHGGLVAAVLDEVMVRLLFLRGMPAVTAGMETKLLRPLRWGREYRFDGWIVRDRGRAVLTEAEAYDVESGERVAWASATCVRVAERARLPGGKPRE
jgi:acyl-coenzyme A thioesterase PaaI-like protein